MRRWIRKLNFSTKLLVIMIAGILPLIILSVLYLSQEQHTIDTMQDKLAGLARYQNLQAMLLPVGEHAIWSAAATARSEAAADRLQASSDELTRLMNQQEAVNTRYGAQSDEDAQHWNELKAAWSVLVSARAASVADVVRMHSLLRQKILDYRDYIAADSNLLLDANPATYFMLDATVMQMPNYEGYVTEMRSHVASVGAVGKPTLADVEQITRDEVLAQQALEQIAADIRHADEGRAADTVLRDDALQSLGQVRAAFDGFSQYVKNHVTAGASSDPLDAILQSTAPLTASISSFHDSMQSSVDRQLQQSLQRLRATRNRALLLVIAAVAIGVGFMGVVIGTTVSGIGEAVAVVSRLADGDYAQAIVAQGTDELARMMQALQTMQAKLSGVLSSVKESAITVASAAREINAGTSDLSARTEQQAASLEETASSMEQMTATVRQNADNARLADKLAQAARDQAERGGAIVEQTVAAMAAIDVSSKKIADIISVIDEIAFQTNLLALNAAVEAARAGDQGRGFAVVASEVRNLAQRSASAAKEIKGLIHDSVSKVGEGGRLVSESGRHLGEIVAAVKKVSDVVGEISNASQEQAASADEVSHAVLQMDQSTQQNAAMVEQTSAAAGSMNELAARLTELTAFFRLGDQATEEHTDTAAVTALAAAAHTVGAKAAGRRPEGRANSVARHGVRTRHGVGARPGGPARPSVAAKTATEQHPSLPAASGGDWDEF